MKILHLNTSDLHGGAARATYRLHRALLAENVDSQMFVQQKISDDFTVLNATNKVEKLTNKLRPFFDSLPVKKYKQHNKNLFSPAWLPFSQLVKHIDKINPDIVHLHWINSGMISINDLAKIKKPLVWSMHDNWLFTGGCHIKWNCEKYKVACESCPCLGSDKNQDLSHKVFNQKQKFFGRLDNLTVIGLSDWVTDCAKQSALLGDKTVIRLPNLLNTQDYSPIEKSLARQLLNLPQDRKLILFGAMSATSDKNKGFDQLTEALQHLQLENVELIVFGSGEPQFAPKFKQPVRYSGQLHDDSSLKVLYSAADVMVVPSLQENLSNAIMESLACGTPVVAFNVGGNTDMIIHQHNGYLAKPLNTKDLANGINWVLINPTIEQLGKNARQTIMEKFDSKIVVKQYITLYQSIFDNNKEN